MWLCLISLSPSADADCSACVRQAHLRLVHPTPDDIPSCFRLIELAMDCHSICSQMKSRYRHDKSSRCAYKHNDFKFCLSMSWVKSNQRYEAWINRRAE
ncbi:hypothetical protein ARMGADRAFT_917769 [Armillaria gallica]|uniref:Uncharacterized protein n=1 Tax=Armillaria gallica TaxID=47427 RepID=A0A2H3DY90_ARMGA|nr:hypothetical protein ARMGADRAFT_917769 [Armillaria gallica]